MGTLCVVYGRRRVGKTRLITHWLNSRKAAGFYWLATDSSPAALLRSLSHALYEHLHKRPPADTNFTYFNWDELFQELVRLVRGSEQKQVVILDEFTYAIRAYPDLPAKLQSAWDRHLRDKPILLILSGSHVGMMEDDVLASRSPLYGRATGLLKMNPLPFKDVRTLFPQYDIASSIALYSVLGGVPYYLERINPALSVVDNIINKVMGWSALVQDGPQLAHITRDAYQAVWQTIERHWRAFVGSHTFEELCREWVYAAAETNRLSFLPQRVGSHWRATEQIDVVAVNWDEAVVLYGGCKWKWDSPLNEGEVKKLFQQAEKIQLTTRSGNPFSKQYVFFSPAGFTDPARDLAASKDAILVDLAYLDEVLADAIR